MSNTYHAVERESHSLSFLLNNRRNQSGVGAVITRLRDGLSRDHASIPAGSKDLSLLQSAQTGCGAHPDSSLVSAGGNFLVEEAAW